MNARGAAVVRPTWWGARRYGIFVHSNLATVPAWSPIGQYSDWYQSHLGEPVPDVLLHPSPMVEVLAHHRERWGHVERLDDFLPLLTYDRFDADAWVDLARDAGMGYSVFVSKHHDGLCWWDAPGTDRTVQRDGPRRNVMREFAAACARADVVFGTYYSLLDWGDQRYPTDAYVDEVLHPQVLDLVERYGSAVLWGDGHWGHGPDRWRSEELIARARELQPELVVNDRWWVADPDVATYEYQTPDHIVDTPWELCRGIGHSFCHNRAERAEHHMTARDIVGLLTEVVAKGGNLLLNVGPAADGTIPELQAAPLRRAGTWVNAHHDLVNHSRPWHTWGDEHVRYLVPQHDPTAGSSCTPPRDPRAPAVVDAVVMGGGAPWAGLAALSMAGGRVVSVADRAGAAVEWEQRDTGLRIRRTDRRPAGLAPVYRIEVEHPAEAPIELFSSHRSGPIDLADRFEGTGIGSVVQLGDGIHAGPVTVPAGVTLRGLGTDRTIVESDGPTAVVLERGARLEHLTVRTSVDRVAWFSVPLVRAAGSDVLVLGCTIEGHVAVGDGIDQTKVRASQLHGVVAEGATRVTVSRCRLRGMRWDVGIDITGGYGHLIESCELHHHLCAVRLTGTLESTVRGNHVEARWWGVHLVGTDASQVSGNATVGTMRAVDVDGGTAAEVSGNAVADGDSGCVIERGATGTIVSGNRWERCRIGLLAWDAGTVSHHDNAGIDLHEPDHTVLIGPG
jgi:alpha-L-fucosidase